MSILSQTACLPPAKPLLTRTVFKGRIARKDESSPKEAFINHTPFSDCNEHFPSHVAFPFQMPSNHSFPFINPVSHVTTMSKPMSTTTLSVYDLPQLPPTVFLPSLNGKFNFHHWLTGIKPYIFSHPAITGLVLGGWPKPSKLESTTRVRGKTGIDKSSQAANPSAPSAVVVIVSTSHIDNWDRANYLLCSFIRGTLGTHVVPLVSHLNTARELWLYLHWLYGEANGIDTLVEAPIPLWTETGSQEEARSGVDKDQESVAAEGCQTANGTADAPVSMQQAPEVDSSDEEEEDEKEKSNQDNQEASSEGSSPPSFSSSSSSLSDSDKCSARLPANTSSVSSPWRLNSATPICLRAGVRSPQPTTQPRRNSLALLARTPTTRNQPALTFSQQTAQPELAPNSSRFIEQFDNEPILPPPGILVSSPSSPSPLRPLSETDLSTIHEEPHPGRRVDLGKRFGIINAKTRTRDSISSIISLATSSAGGENETTTCLAREVSHSVISLKILIPLLA